MTRTLASFLSVTTLLLQLAAATASAGNFVAADPELVRVAEECRSHSALFWTGQALPGSWSSPCPIQLETTAKHGGSRTNFRFSNGEVFGWRMTVTGSRDDVISNVLPHEVDHMVRASLVRHPLERWLDEGAASLMESPDVHRRLRERASRVPVEHVNLRFLSAKDYPANATECDEVYAVGFSLVEFLLSRDTPEALLSFQRSLLPMSERLVRHYDLTTSGLQQEWETWRRRQAVTGFRCADCRCPVHGMRPQRPVTRDERPVLTIWTADWCGPCQLLKRDLAFDLRFREAVGDLVRLEWRDAEREQQGAGSSEIESFPTMQLGVVRWSGYVGPGEFMGQLRAAMASASTVDSNATGEPQEVPRVPEAPPSTSTPAAADLVIVGPETRDVEGISDRPEDVPPVGKTTDHVIPDPVDLPVRRTREANRDPTRASETKTALPAGLDWIRKIGGLLGWGGILAGAVTTGGLGGIAVTIGLQLLRGVVRRRGSRNVPRLGESEVRSLPAPFPRQLDEARQLLAIRQSEGRVAVLDALRGMFLDDECDKAAGDPQKSAVISQLRAAIDERVQQVAPLSVETGDS